MGSTSLTEGGEVSSNKQKRAKKGERRVVDKVELFAVCQCMMCAKREREKEGDGGGMCVCVCVCVLCVCDKEMEKEKDREREREMDCEAVDAIESSFSLSPSLPPLSLSSLLSSCP